MKGGVRNGSAFLVIGFRMEMSAGMFGRLGKIAEYTKNENYPKLKTDGFR